MFALAIRRVREPHSRQRGVRCGARSSRTYVHSRPVFVLPRPGASTGTGVAVRRVTLPHPLRDAGAPLPAAPAIAVAPPTQSRQRGALQFHPDPRINLFLAVQRGDGHNISKRAPCASKPGPARPRAIRRLGASACTILSQCVHASLGHTCWISPEVGGGILPGSRETSSPKAFSAPPQSGQAVSLGRIVPFLARQNGPAASRRAGFRPGAATRGCRLPA